MTNRASVMWKILKGLAKKWPEIVVKWTIVTTRLGESVFITATDFNQARKKGLKSLCIYYVQLSISGKKLTN